MTGPTLCFASLLPFAILACQVEDLVAVGSGASTSPGGEGSGDCGTSFPRVSLARPDGSLAELCSGLLAARTFTQAMCACGDISIPGTLVSTAENSADAGRERGGASVGVNGNYARVGAVGLDGGLKVAAGKPITTAGSVRIGGDLWLAGSATIAGVVSVERDAWLTESMSTVGVATIGRDLHVAPGAMLSPIGVLTVLGTTTSEAFTIVKPCACDPEQLLDIASLVGGASTSNDNASIGLSPDALSAGRDVPVDLTLPCGRFYLQELRTSAPVHLNVTGRVALFVAGEVDATSQFVLEIGPGAELDLFVLGNFLLDPAARLGDTGRPAGTRVYVQGAQEIRLPGTANAGFNLYAPATPVSIDGTGDVYGSVFAGNVSANPDLILHYDRAIVRAGETCGASAGDCERCAQCNAGPACVANACFTCATDADCCAPFACESGMCQLLTTN